MNSNLCNPQIYHFVRIVEVSTTYPAGGGDVWVDHDYSASLPVGTHYAQLNCKSDDGIVGVRATGDTTDAINHVNGGSADIASLITEVSAAGHIDERRINGGNATYYLVGYWI